MWKKVRGYPFGEAALWLLFIVAGLAGMSGSSSTTITFAGLCAIAAIGVRAPRPEVVRE